MSASIYSVGKPKWDLTSDPDIIITVSSTLTENKLDEWLSVPTYFSAEVYVPKMYIKHLLPRNESAGNTTSDKEDTINVNPYSRQTDWLIVIIHYTQWPHLHLTASCILDGMGSYPISKNPPVNAAK